MSTVLAVVAMRLSSAALAQSSCEGRSDTGIRFGFGGEKIDITWAPGKIPDVRAVSRVARVIPAVLAVLCDITTPRTAIGRRQLSADFIING